MPDGDETKTLEECEKSLTMFVMLGEGPQSNAELRCHGLGANVNSLKEINEKCSFWLLAFVYDHDRYSLVQEHLVKKIFALVDDIIQKLSEPLAAEHFGRIHKTFPAFCFVLFFLINQPFWYK